jgi:hypothetical protein
MLHGHGDDIAIYIQIDDGILVEIAALDDIRLAEFDIPLNSEISRSDYGEFS